MSRASLFLALTKPRILALVLLSGLPALAIAGGGWPAPGLALATLLGTALTAAAANAFNSYLEREPDALMERTRDRPLPSGALPPTQALVFGFALGALGVGLLWRVSGPTAAGLALAAVAVYVFVYTLWLKPRTPFAVVVGGFSGAIAPLIADAAIQGHVGAAGWLLFALIFIWQPPHFYAIALFRREDYARAGFPMLPDRIGEEATYDRIVWWSVALVPVTLLPLLLPGLGPVYGTTASLLGVLFLRRAWQLRRQRDTASARRLFLFSLAYLFGLFTAMIIDLALSF